jgi:hypothetical protein
MFDFFLKNSFLVFKNLKLKNLIGNSILQKCFQKLFSVYQFLKTKKVKQIIQEVLLFSI